MLWEQLHGLGNIHHFLLQTFTKQSHTNTGHINLLVDIICPLKNDSECDIHVSKLLKSSFDSLIENVVKGFKKHYIENSKKIK